MKSQSNTRELRPRGLKAPNPMDKYPKYIQKIVPKETTYQEIPDTNQGQIYKEIIDNYDIDAYPLTVKRTKENSGDTAFFDPGKTPSLNLPDQIEPGTLAHELMHSEDQRKHHTYKKIWENIKKYATANNIRTWQDLNGQLNPIQDKIDPTKAFRNKYLLNSDYLNQDIDTVLKDTKKNQINNQITDDAWHRINQTLSQNDARFPLNYASEYPSFMMERITKPWRTGGGSTRDPALTSSQASLLHSMLGSMGDAYPANRYPSMYNAINERRRSIERAHGLEGETESPRPNSPQTMSGGFRQTLSPKFNPFRIEYTEDQARRLNRMLPKGYSLQRLDERVQPSSNLTSFQQVPNPLMQPVTLNPQQNTFSTMSGGYPSMGTNQFMTQNQPNLSQGLQSWVSGNYGQGATLSGTNPFGQMTMSNQYGSQFGSDFPQSFNQGSQQLGTSGQDPNPLLQKMRTRPQQNPIVINLRKTDSGYKVID